ncbi:MAG TPA: hypothetical protein VK453_04310 [Micromonosporaceae bacterium]|nr:hypothetical protein [Micromonosporaceae bacterium]
MTSTKRYRLAAISGIAATLVAAGGLSPMVAAASTAREANSAAADGFRQCAKQTFQVRTYTLATAEAAQAYLGVWAKHAVSLKAFGIQTLKYEVAPGTDGLQIRALVAYPAGSDPAVLDVAYRASAQFKEDMVGFDFTQMRGAVSRLVDRPSFD